MISSYNFCMEVEDVPCLALPLDVVSYINKWKDTGVITYTTMFRCGREVNALPWTNSPILLKACFTNTPLDEDLSNPKPNTQVIPNAQLWIVDDQMKFRLSEDIQRTDDIYYVDKKEKEYSTMIFDGINTQRKAVFCLKHDSNQPKIAHFKIFEVAQSSECKKDQEHGMIKPIIIGTGIVRSLMLERERNRIIYSVDQQGESLYKIHITDILSGQHAFPYQSVAEVVTSHLFVKTVSLAKGTYFGITSEGKLYCLWIDNQNKIQLAEQTFSKNPKQFKDISVDNTVVTDKGFHPQIAFLTTTGDIFVTHLDAFAQPTLFYIDAVNDAANVKRLFYNAGKILIIYNRSEDIYERQDNFGFLYFYAIMKKMQPTICD